MHAFLYIGGSVAQRINAIQSLLDREKVPSYDRIVLQLSDKPSVGVADVRVFIKQLYLTPQTPQGIAAVIPALDTLTVEAQQALLKTIEEPPPHVRLYLGTSSETGILPTIVSRCQLNSLPVDANAFDANELAACSEQIRQLRTVSFGKRMTLIQALGKTKDDMKHWLDCAIISGHTMALSDGRYVPMVHALLDAKRLSANNINPYHLVEHIFLTL